MWHHDLPMLHRMRRNGFGHVRRAGTVALFLASGACRCGGEAALPDRGTPEIVARPPVAAPQPAATRAAFDSVAATDGALLFFGPPSDDGGGLRVQPLDALGGARGAETIVSIDDPDDVEAVSSYVLEVAAAAGGGRVGVAWTVRRRLAVDARASHGSDRAETFAPVIELGETEIGPRIVRGVVAVAASDDGTLAAFHRAGRGPCVDGGTDRCVYVANERLGGSTGSDGRRGLPLAIPEVCDGPVPGYAWVDGTQYYALCTIDEGVPATTVYGIRFEPQYAEADRVLVGATPIGLARAGEGAVVVLGRRDDRVDAVRYANVGQERALLDDVTRRVRCDGVRPNVELVPASGNVVTIELRGPESRIEAVLPEEIAPAGARAVWTGEALLVAVPFPPEVVIHRFQCVDGELTRTDSL